MFTCKNLGSAILSFFLFTVLVTCEGWAGFELDEKLDRDVIQRCFAACSMAEALKEGRGIDKALFKWWAGESWSGLAEERDVEPTIYSISLNPEKVDPFLGSQFSVVMVAKERDVTIGFSDFPPEVVKHWIEKKQEIVDLAALAAKEKVATVDNKKAGDGDKYSPFGGDGDKDDFFVQGNFNVGNGDKISLDLWKQVSNELGEKIAAYRDEYRRKYGMVLDFGKCDVRMTGLGAGGMVAQWGAIDAVNEYCGGQNYDSIGLITFGTPKVFDKDAADRWHDLMGGAENHLRFTIVKDPFLQYGEGCPSKEYTGCEQRVKEGKLGVGLTGTVTGGNVYHSLWLYKQAFNNRGGVYRTVKGAVTDALWSAGGMIGSLIGLGKPASPSRSASSGIDSASEEDPVEGGGVSSSEGDTSVSGEEEKKDS